METAAWRRSAGTSGPQISMDESNLVSAEQCVGVLERVKDWARREVVVVIGDAVNDSEVVELVAVRAGCEQPHEGLDARRPGYRRSPRGTYLACTDSSDPSHGRNGVELIVEKRNVPFDAGIMFDKSAQRPRRTRSGKRRNPSFPDSGSVHSPDRCDRHTRRFPKRTGRRRKRAG